MNDSPVKTESVIEIEEAVVAYRDGVALNGVSLSVQSGEVVGVIGPNGAGKTTLLTIINGLASRTHGNVTTLGLRPYAGDGHRVRKQVAYVAQVENIDSRHPMTVREMVLAGMYGRLGWLRKPRKEHWRFVDNTLEQVHAHHLAKRPVGQLSGGEYQRAAIARAIVQQPSIFLFDEPTASIDPKAQLEILQLVQDIHRHSAATMVYVTHELATLPKICTRILHMKNGCITGDGPPSSMLQTHSLDALYDKPVPQAASYTLSLTGDY